MEYAWGQKSAVSVSAGAGAYCEGLDRRRVDPRILQLARSRGHGQHTREAIDAVFPMNGVLEPVQVADSSVEWVLLPHMVLDWLQAEVPRKFRQLFGAKEEGLADWWHGLLSSESGRE